MTADEILQVHAKNQGIDPRLLRGEAKEFLKSPKTQIFQQGDCLFLVKFEDDIGYFHLFNGGGASQYLRSLRMFVKLMKKLGLKKIAIRVDDKEQSKKIAASIGALSSEHKYIGGKVDPYLMTMKV
jgi:hypothetical protein